MEEGGEGRASIGVISRGRWGGSQGYSNSSTRGKYVGVEDDHCGQRLEIGGCMSKDDKKELELRDDLAEV